MIHGLTCRQIARNEFPMFKPRASLSQSASQAIESPSQPAILNHASSSESADKENAPPASELASNHVTEIDDALPREILIRLDSVIKTLSTYFKTYPPHTVQRLSELILEPRKHYRNLPAYLHALDRVINVTSGANTYPLPAAFPAVLTNGNTASNSNNVAWSTSTLSTLGSDESLGGALLTPIPWLLNGSKSESIDSNSRSGSGGSIEREVRTESTETIEGPNGAGSIETVTVSVFNSGMNQSTLQNISNQTQENSNPPTTISSLRAEGGVTQGELIRQEQQLNIVPAAQITGRLSDADGKSEDDDIPHARGPEEVGVADTGPQSPRSESAVGTNMESLGINVEAAIGRPADEEVPAKTAVNEEVAAEVPRTPKREAGEDLERETKRAKSEDVGGIEKKQSLEETKKEEDAEIVPVKAEEEIKVGKGDESKSDTDAADTTGE